jgi:hypothetical protein
LLAAVGLALLALPPAPAQAQAASLDVVVERDPDQPPRFSELHVPVRVTVTDRATGGPPAREFEVYITAVTAAGEETEAFPSYERANTDPGATPGVYLALVILPRSGNWTLRASVNEFRADQSEAPVVLAQAEAGIEVAGDAALASAAQPDEDAPAGSVRTLGFLWLHSVFAAAWGLVVAALLGLSVPAGRRLLSEWGANLVDRHLDTLVKATYAITAGVVLTGIYNLRFELPYPAPLTTDDATAVFRLPFAQPYFLALAAKLIAYGIMVGATFPLVREARRRTGGLRTTAGGGVTLAFADDDPSPWDDLSGGPLLPRRGSRGVALAERRRAAPVVGPTAEEPTRRPVRVAALVLAAGGAVVWAGVVLIKYFHLLSEAARL